MRREDLFTAIISLQDPFQKSSPSSCLNCLRQLIKRDEKPVINVLLDAVPNDGKLC